MGSRNSMFLCAVAGLLTALTNHDVLGSALLDAGIGLVIRNRQPFNLVKSPALPT